MLKSKSSLKPAYFCPYKCYDIRHDTLAMCEAHIGPGHTQGGRCETFNFYGLNGMSGPTDRRTCAFKSFKGPLTIL